MNKLPQSPKHIAALFVLATFAPALLAASSNAPVISNVQVPLSGTVFVPLSDGSIDTVSLTSKVDVHTSYQAKPISTHESQNPISLHFDLNRANRINAVGTNSRLQYVATGTKHLRVQEFPKAPMKVSFDLNLVNPPPDTHTYRQISTLDITFRLMFNPSTGALLNVDIESMSVPVP